MSDREAWIAVFNAVFHSTMTSGIIGPLCNATTASIVAKGIARATADEALKDAPEDHP